MKRTFFLVAILIVTVSLVGCIGKKRYTQKAQEVSKLQKQLDDLDKREEALKSALESVETEKKQVVERAKQKEEAIEKLKKTQGNLLKELKKEIEQGEIKITQLEDKLTLKMVEQILFRSGNSDVTKEGKDVLTRIGKKLKEIKGNDFRIEGHTDNLPISKKLRDQFPTNWELSTSRATNVAKYLIYKAGLDPKNISVSGYADTRPIDSNATKEGRMKNRRIEIVLVPEDISVKKVELDKRPKEAVTAGLSK